MSVKRSALGGIVALAMGAAIVGCAGPENREKPEAARPPSVEEKGLLAYWKFDDAAGDIAVDISGHDNDAEVWNAEWVKGRFGAALRFTGEDSRVSVPGIEGLDGAGEMTAEAWVLWEGTGRYPNILTAGKWNPGGFMIFVADNACSFRMGRPGAAAWPGPEWKETGANLLSPFSLNRWYHLAVVFRRPQIKTYVDGRPVGSAQWDFPVGCSGDLVLGSWAGKVCHRGLMDEVKLYNRALTDQEIAASYQKESPQRTVAAGEGIYERIPEMRKYGRPALTLENGFAKLVIDERARCVALLDKATGKDILAKPLPLVTLKKGSVTSRGMKCSREGDKLTVAFGKSGTTAVIGAKSKGKYFVFEVLSVSDKEAEELAFVNLAVKPDTYVNGTFGVAADDEFGLCLRALNLQTQASAAGKPPILRAVCTQTYGLEGGKVALAACPQDRLRAALKEVVKNEGQLVSSLGGPWALDAEDNRGSYLFAQVSEANVDQWIALAKRTGFTHVHLCPWWQTLGHYEPSQALFPHGLEGIKACVKKIHAAGLKAGMHTLTGCISTNDSWVTPVPDKRLAVDAEYTLAEAMDETSKTILTVEKPGKHDTIWSYAGGGNVIRIGDELIHYASISYEPPYGFLECTRGAFKTQVSAHAKGAPAGHLLQRYLAFYPDENSTLVGEVADCIARVFNECEMDQIYMDGAEGMHGWHGVAVMRGAIYERLKRPGIVEASCWDHHSWVFHSRVGAWDHAKWGLKPFTDRHCKDIPSYRKGGLLQAQLGWWAVLGPSAYGRAETPDEMEYFCCKTFAHDAPTSIQSIYVGRKLPNARQDEYLTLAGRYERLRLSNYFTEEVRAALREPGKEFRLDQAEDGEWRFIPTDYLEHKVTALNNGSSAWTVGNRFDAQPLRLRIEALYALQPYEGKDALPVEDFADAARFTIHANASGVTHTLETSKEQVKAGQASGRFSAKNAGASRRGAWARAGRAFTPHLNMKPADGVGLWIHGDGKGEVLNIQLTNPPEYMQALTESYVVIDFTGWRYVELPLRERDADKFQDYEWPYFSLGGIFMTDLTRDHVSEMNLYLNNLPPNDTATIYLGPIKALRADRVALRNPAVEINGKRLTIPAALESGRFIEFDSMADCRVYDERWALTERVSLQGEAPELRSGENKVAFTCEGPEGFSARALVTVIASGPPLRGRTPEDKIKKQYLREEYELPQTISALDGKENQWTVRCRPDAKGAQLQIELDVEQVGDTSDRYDLPGALTLESFDDLTGFAESPQNQYAKYAFDAEDRSVPAKPGVTRTLDLSTDLVKVGKTSARYTAASARSDSAGWAAKGKRFTPPLDLSSFSAIAFWIYGDAKGESLKLQLRDTAGKWYDMVTKIDFSGWQCVEFDLADAKMDLTKVEYAILYYNGIPGGQTVVCRVDDIRAVGRPKPLRNLTVGVDGARLVFPVSLSAGDRLAFKGLKDCRVYRKDGSVEAVQAEGEAIKLTPGAHAVTIGADADSPKSVRLRVALTKVYSF